jgi:hypothetical protein
VGQVAGSREQLISINALLTSLQAIEPSEQHLDRRSGFQTSSVSSSSIFVPSLRVALDFARLYAIGEPPPHDVRGPRLAESVERAIVDHRVIALKSG